jgi:hypothetical protein
LGGLARWRFAADATLNQREKQSHERSMKSQ